MSDTYPAPLHLPAAPPAVESPPSSLLLRRRDAADLVGVSCTTWDRWCAGGLAPAGRRVGTCLLWPRDELTSWVVAGMPPAAEWSARWNVIQRRRK